MKLRIKNMKVLLLLVLVAAVIFPCNGKLVSLAQKNVDSKYCIKRFNVCLLPTNMSDCFDTKTTTFRYNGALKGYNTISYL
jgi:hypothetical protein